MRKIFLMLIMLLILTGCGKNENELVMVTEAGFAPFEYYENGEIVGVDIEIAKEIASELGKELVIKDVAFDSIINEVKTGKADLGAAGISYSEERSKQVDFSNDYFTSNLVTIIRKSDNESFFNNLNNKIIAVQLGSTADTYVTKNYNDKNIIRQKKYLTTVEDLKNKKADCIIMDELPAKAIVNNNSELKIIDRVLSSENYGMIVKKGNEELLKVVNKVINRLITEGKIDNYIIEYTK